MSLHPNVRRCTHIHVTGHRCGSPALKGEYFCYFHTRMIKGVETRVDSQLHPTALIESAEAIQSALMHMIDAVLKGAIDNKRAALVLKALHIAVRNSRNVYFSIRQDDMVREVPNYAQQYLAEHPAQNPSEPTTTRVGTGVSPLQAERTSAASSPLKKPCHPEQARSSRESKDPQNAGSHNDATGHSHLGAKGDRENPKPDPTPPLTTRQSQRWNEIKKLEASVEHAMRGDWRALRTVFHAVGLTPGKSYSAQTVNRHRVAKPAARPRPKPAQNLDPRAAAEDNAQVRSSKIERRARVPFNERRNQQADWRLSDSQRTRQRRHGQGLPRAQRHLRSH